MTTIFKRFQDYLKTQDRQKAHQSQGLGLRRVKSGQTLDVWYFALEHLSSKENVLFLIFSFIKSTHSGLTELTQHEIQQMKDVTESVFAQNPTADLQTFNVILQSLTQKKQGFNYSECELIHFALDDLSSPVQSVEEAYFKLHLLSKRLIQPHSANLTQLFSVLPNVAWTNYGPLLISDVDSVRAQMYFSPQPLHLTHVDKFPYMLNYCVPEGVRVAEASKVRLGAHLASGTTVMPAGYVNFNAGTLGASMIEGRVSAGVVVGAGSDVGGGASIMGTLSGGGQHQVSIGKNCLIGANAGTGISLGDGCTIGAGVYVTAGSKVSLYNHKHEPINLNGERVTEGDNIVKALQLNGKRDLLFYQDSQTGKLMAKPNPKTVALNPDLHAQTD